MSQTFTKKTKNLEDQVSYSSEKSIIDWSPFSYQTTVSVWTNMCGSSII